jgi:hypothetical protein
MTSEDYYGTYSMRLLQSYRKMKKWYSERIEIAADSLDKTQRIWALFWKKIQTNIIPT